MKNWLISAWKGNRSFLIFIVFMFIFRSAVADWNEVPTGSMKPTILEGDRILVNKMAYDIRVPFTKFSLVKRSDPVRGDIVIFDSEVSGQRLVKRVVGIPGDSVELQNNVLIINGRKLDYETVRSAGETVDKQEDMGGMKHLIRINRNGTRISSFTRRRVPADHYLVLGDNRDNSADSRAIGLVPRHEIVGRSRQVVLSLDYENFYLPRQGRFFHIL